MRVKYRDVILLMTVLRRLDAVLYMKTTLDDADIIEQDAILRQIAGQSFYNTSKFTLRDLRSIMAYPTGPRGGHTLTGRRNNAGG